MTIDKAKFIGLVAFAIVASGCSSSDDSDQLPNDDSVNLNDPEPVVIVVTDNSEPPEVTDEVTDDIDASEGSPTPVTPVSSFEMDEFIVNPLLTPVPPELEVAATTGLPDNFVVNPLLD